MYPLLPWILSDLVTIINDFKAILICKKIQKLIKNS